MNAIYHCSKACNADDDNLTTKYDMISKQDVTVKHGMTENHDDNKALYDREKTFKISQSSIVFLS